MRRRAFAGAFVGLAAGLGRAVAAPAAQGQAIRRLHMGDVGTLLLVSMHAGDDVGWWLLDTGASANLVSSEAAARWALTARGNSEAATVGAVSRMTKVTLPPLEGLGRRWEAQAALVAPLHDYFAPSGVVPDGVLGLPVLGTQALRIDLRRDRIAASTPPTVVDPTLELPLGLEGGLPTVALAIGARPAHPFLLDTGFAGALVLFGARADAELQRRIATLPLMQFRELGGPIESTQVLFERVAAGGFEQRRVPAAIERGEVSGRARTFARVAGAVGPAFFTGCVLSLDLPGRRLLIEPGDADERAIPGGFGFSVQADSGALRIGGLFAEGPAARAGLAAGERIVSVDGQPGPLSSDALWALLAPRADARLGIERAGHIDEIELHRAAFFPALE